MSWGGRGFSSGTFGGAIAGMAITIGLSGVAATGSVGTVTPARSVAVTGNIGTGAVGSVTNSRSVALTGDIGTGVVGTVQIPEQALTGNTATGSVGTVAVSVAGGSCSLALTGVQATASVNNVAVSVTGGTCALNLTGNQADGSAGTIRTALASVAPSVSSVAAAYYAYADVFSSPITFSWDGTGSNFLVVTTGASFAYPDPVITGITFNGVALTQRSTLHTNDGYYFPASEVWTLAAPASGVHDLVVTYTGYTYGFDITAIGLKDVTAIDANTTQQYLSSDATQPRTITINSTAYDLCIAVLTTAYTDLSPSAGQSTPAVIDDTGAYLRHRVGVKEGAGSTTTLGWTETTTDYITAMAGISLTGVGPAQATIALSGNQATGSVGSVTPSPSKALTGNTGTGVVGTVTPSITYGAILSGNQATGSVGTITANVQGDLTAALSGNIGTGVVGSVSKSITVGLTGNTATGLVGSVGFTLGGSAALTGNIGTGAIGSLATSREVALTGVNGTGVAGSMGISNSCALALTGNNAFGAVGNVTPPVKLLEGSWQRGSGHKTRADQ